MRSLLRAHNAAECDYGWGSAPDPTGGAYIAPTDSLAVLRDGGEREGGGEEEGKEKEGKKKGGKGGKLEQGR